jgi:CheY-like chemotaxis protein
LTGHGEPEDRRRALAAGFDQHLVKPVDTKVLLLELETEERS